MDVAGIITGRNETACRSLEDWLLSNRVERRRSCSADQFGLLEKGDRHRSSDANFRRHDERFFAFAILLSSGKSKTSGVVCSSFNAAVGSDFPSNRDASV